MANQSDQPVSSCDDRGSLGIKYGFHGSSGLQAKYTGYYDRDFGLVKGRLYRVFSYKRGERGQGFSVSSATGPTTYPDLLSVRVEDPTDRFGGVVQWPASDFELIQDWSI